MTVTHPRSAKRHAGIASESHVLLRDGRSVRVRPIRSSDDERLMAFHEALSLSTVRDRFFYEHRHLTAAEAHRFAEVDFVARIAFVAVDGDRILGVARCEPTDVEHVGEVAIVLADDVQGLGLGTQLLRTVARSAARAGYQALAAYVRPTNTRMLRMLLAAGGRRVERADDGTLEIRVALHGAAAPEPPPA